MPRPKTKEELLFLSQNNFARLNALVDGFSSKERALEFPDGTLNRNVRDVLAHLHHWHEMMLEWYEVGMAGDKPEMPAKGYTWRTVPLLNRKIREMYADAPLEEVRRELKRSFSKLQKVIMHHNQQELFERRYYPWTGSTSLGSYLISATSSHYDWAYKLIRRVKKKQQAA